MPFPVSRGASSVLHVTKGVHVYFVIVGLILASGLGFPIPEEIPIVLGGAAAGKSAGEHPHWFIMLPICIVAVVIGDFFLYTIGRLGGRRLLRIRWVEQYLIKPEKRNHIEHKFHHHGVKILLAARFMPGVRTPIFIMAGVLKMPLLRFIIADGIYAIPGVSILFGLAWWFTDSFVSIVENFENGVALIKPLLAIAVIAGVIVYLFRVAREQSRQVDELEDEEKAEADQAANIQTPSAAP